MRSSPGDVSRLKFAEESPLLDESGGLGETSVVVSEKISEGVSSSGVYCGCGCSA